MQFINQPDAENDEEWWQRFKELLDDQNEWPTRYTFKFIAPSDSLDRLKHVFGDHPVRVRESSKGNYKSVTAHLQMSSSEEVVEIYQEASSIDGVISL
jgi:putative lipoic acid-binding regulatory protein